MELSYRLPPNESHAFETNIGYETTFKNLIEEIEVLHPVQSNFCTKLVHNDQILNNNNLVSSTELESGDELEVKVYLLNLIGLTTSFNLDEWMSIPLFDPHQCVFPAHTWFMEQAMIKYPQLVNPGNMEILLKESSVISHNILNCVDFDIKYTKWGNVWSYMMHDGRLQQYVKISTDQLHNFFWGVEDGHICPKIVSDFLMNHEFDAEKIIKNAWMRTSLMDELIKESRYQAVIMDVDIYGEYECNHLIDYLNRNNKDIPQCLAPCVLRHFHKIILNRGLDYTTPECLTACLKRNLNDFKRIARMILELPWSDEQKDTILRHKIRRRMTRDILQIYIDLGYSTTLDWQHTSYIGENTDLIFQLDSERQFIKAEKKCKTNNSFVALMKLLTQEELIELSKHLSGERRMYVTTAAGLL